MTLSLSPKEKENLEEIAQLFGQTWGERANISRLMRAIASGELKVVQGRGEAMIATPDANKSQPTPVLNKRKEKVKKWEGKREEIESLILSGDSLTQIAKQLGISRQRVHQICDSHNIDVNLLIQQRESRLIDSIRIYAEQGLAIGEIANKMGLSYCQVRQRAADNCIKCQKKVGIKAQIPKGNNCP